MRQIPFQGLKSFPLKCRTAPKACSFIQGTQQWYSGDDCVKKVIFFFSVQSATRTRVSPYVGMTAVRVIPSFDIHGGRHVVVGVESDIVPAIDRLTT